MKIKFYLKNPTKKESLIVARILWGNFQLPYSTKQFVETAYWIKTNNAGQRVQKVKQTTKYPQNAEINQALDELKTNIQRAFVRYTNDSNFEEPNPVVLKELLNTYLKRGKQKVVKQKLPSFMDYLENYFIKRSEKGVRKDRKKGNALSKDTVKTYNTLLGHLKEYNTGLDWKDINMNFHAEYTEFLTEEYELSSSSIGKDISIVKLVCREAYHEKINDEKINKYDDYADPYFTVSRETANSIYLTTDEINLLWNLDLSKDKSLEETRDLFVLGCITGLRYSDYSKIKKEQVDEFKLHVKTVKGGKQLEVNIRDPKAQAIIKKYNIHFPQGAVNQVFNRNLREICKDIPQFQTLITKEYTKGGRKIVEEIPKYEMIKSHTARRSYVTNEVKAKTPIAVIMNNSGHTSEKSFWKYVKLNKGDYFEVYDKIMKERNDLKVAS